MGARKRISRPLTASQASEYLARWPAVRMVELQEERRATPADRLRRVEALAGLARVLGWPTRAEDEPETAAVRERWARLRGPRP